MINDFNGYCVFFQGHKRLVTLVLIPYYTTIWGTNKTISMLLNTFVCPTANSVLRTAEKFSLMMETESLQRKAALREM